MSDYGWNDATEGATDWSDFSGEGAITEMDYAKIELDTVYPAVITSILKPRDLPRRADKPPTRVLTYTLSILAKTDSGKEVEMERKLRDVWILGPHNGNPADYSSLFNLARTCMDDEFVTDEDGMPLIDEEHTIEWWVNQVVGHSLYVMSRKGKPYVWNGEERTPTVFYVDSPWPDGPRPKF